MKILLLTVAGMSTRFSQSLGKQCLKCLYTPSDIKETLLYRMITRSDIFDKYIIVGGFMFDELEYEIEQHFSEFKDKIILVKNDKFAKYGSGYSLYKGLESAMNINFNEVVFAEGDLFVDRDSFSVVCKSNKDIITASGEDILADKSVVFYFDQKNCIHYIYDVNHSILEVKEPFLSIHNSGQIWKFAQCDVLKKIYNSMNDTDWHKSNLVFIERYFQSLKNDQYDIVKFDEWINCNTIQDFECIKQVE